MSRMRATAANKQPGEARTRRVAALSVSCVAGTNGGSSAADQTPRTRQPNQRCRINRSLLCAAHSNHCLKYTTKLGWYAVPARARALITQLVVSVAWMWISRLTSQPCSATARTIRRRGPPAHCESNLGLPTMHSLVSQTNAIHGSRIASVAQRPAVVLQRSMTSIRHGCRPSLHVTRLRAMPFCTFDSHRSSCPSVRSAQQLPSSQLIRTFSNARRVKQRRSPAEKLQREIVVPELCTIGRLASILEVSAEGEGIHACRTTASRILVLPFSPDE
eukprot:3407957-Pleurochrysis_carterae.AAC.5